MRKCVSFLLVTVLILTMTVSSRAVKNDEFSSGLDTKVELYTPESFRSIFLNDEGMVRAMLETEEITEIEYHYTFAKQIDNPELADVFLTFVMMVGNVEYTVDVVGTVNSYVLSSGDILWDGPIRGNVCVNNTVYKVIASFSKLESNTDIQVTATVQALNAEDAIEPLIFSFGSDIVTEDIYNELTNIEKATTTGNTWGAPVQPMVNTSDFLPLGTNLTTFYNSTAGTAQTLRGYFNPTTNQFAASIMTHGYNLDDWANSISLIEATTSVSSFEICLTSNSQSGGSYSWIDTIHSYSFTDFDKAGVLIKPLFQDILAILGVPTAIISSMLDGLTGTVEDDVKSNTASVKVRFGLTQVADFDESGEGIPIVFQLDCVPSTYTGKSSYTYSSSITYRTYLWPTNSNTPRYFYVDAYDASKTVTITLS